MHSFNFALTEAKDELEPILFQLVPEGHTYHIAARVGDVPQMQFAAAAKAGLDTSAMDGLAAMYDMLRDCIDGKPAEGSEKLSDGQPNPDYKPATTPEQEWSRFLAEAKSVKMTSEQVFEVVTWVYGELSGRPFEKPTASTDGA